MLRAKKYLLEKTKYMQNQVADFFEIPQDALLNLPRITIIGDVQLYLENHHGIIEYHSGKIRVSISGGELEMSGSNLKLKNIKADEIAVEGKIDRLTFNR